MKLLFLNGSRGEWGYIQPIIDIAKTRGFDCSICATNMLLLPGYGSLINEIKEEGYHVCDEIYMSLEGHNHTTMAKSLAVFMTSFVDTLKREQPDWLILSGDRGEQLMGAITGAYTYTPTAHMQAGELSGNIDGVSRHAIGKFAHIHFAANKDAADRLKKLGEEEFRIHNVGHPALDPIASGKVANPLDSKSRYGLNPDAPFLLVVLHPTTEDFEHAHMQVESLTAALREFNQQKIWILSNNDAGAATVRDQVFKDRTADIRIHENLPREDYLALMKAAQCIVGNSSSGLLEAPTFKLPAVNIGRRQFRRVQGENVINTEFDPKSIKEGIEKACGKDFKASLINITNPYGSGDSADKIFSVLNSVPVDDRLLTKRLTY